MILPIVTGYLSARFLSNRYHAVILGILLGGIMGFIASGASLPFLYPLFSGEAGLIVGPEFSSVGIMFLIPDFVIYREALYYLTQSYVIELVFVLTGILFAALGALYGSTHNK